MKQRFEILDIFRGVFASLIIVFHMRGFTDAVLVNNDFTDNSDVFVDFFFVLSGFVIAYTSEKIADTSQFQKFLKKRFFRIYPLHFITLIIFVAIESLKNYLSGYVHINQPNNINNNIYSFFTNLFLVNSIKMFGINDVTWNIPSWSISAEAVSYLVFGIAVFMINKSGYKNGKVFIYGLLIALAGTAVFLATSQIAFLYTFDYGFLRGLIGFFTGCLCLHCYMAVKDKLDRLPKILYDIAEPVILVVIVFFVYRADIIKPLGYVYNLSFFLAILIFAQEKGFISLLLTKSVFLKRVGLYSYSIYLTHPLLLSLFNILFIRILKFPTSSYTYLVFVNYFIIYKVSGWTYSHIEKRFNISPAKVAESPATPEGIGNISSLKLDEKNSGS